MLFVLNFLSVELSGGQIEEAPYLISAFDEILAKEYDEEFITHIFQNSVEEVILSDLNTFTGKDISDYDVIETTWEKN